MSTSAEHLPSIHDTQTVDIFGVAARKGFEYQDEVATYYLLQMLLREDLLEVRCEREDDVTLIWLVDDSTVVEYMQVKSDDAPSPWSINLLCNPEGSSIFDASIGRDRVSEECRFAFVSRAMVGPTLRPLRSVRADPPFALGIRDLTALTVELAGLRPDVVSPHCSGMAAWADRTRWIEGGQLEDLQQHNRALFQQMPSVLPLLPEQWDGLLDRVRHFAFTAAKATKAADKAVSRDAFRTWFQSTVAALVGVKGQDTLMPKLAAAGVSQEYLAAQELRRKYRALTRKPAPFMDEATRDRTYADLLGQLTLLRRQFASDDGSTFFTRCVTAVAGDPDGGIRLGAMYQATGRCFHWFQLRP